MARLTQKEVDHLKGLKGLIGVMRTSIHAVTHLEDQTGLHYRTLLRELNDVDELLEKQLKSVTVVRFENGTT